MVLPAAKILKNNIHLSKRIITQKTERTTMTTKGFVKPQAMH